MNRVLRRVRRSLAWRLRHVAIELADPDDLKAWYVEDRQRHADPKRVSTVRQSDILNFCRKLAPLDAVDHAKVRLGGSNDGGYVFIDDFDAVSTVISCGISDDVSCDLAFAQLGKNVVQFDHTVEGSPVEHACFCFYKQAIDELREIPGSTRLSDVIRNVGDPSKSDLLLKIDIDGDEWKTFANIPPADLRRCRQIACEFHDLWRMFDPEFLSRYEAALANILKGFFPAHIHANNFRGFSIVLGVALPEVFEVTFVNKQIYRQGARQRIGLKVDAPNDAAAPDLFLGSPFLLTDG